MVRCNGLDIYANILRSIHVEVPFHIFCLGVDLCSDHGHLNVAEKHVAEYLGAQSCTLRNVAIRTASLIQ